MRPRLLVLIGPQGSGKSFLGDLLARELDLDYAEHEAMLIGRWGTLEAFAANKATALAEMEASVRARLETSRRTVVFESTGVSDRPMLERLCVQYPAALVRIMAPRDLCVTRVRSRAPGRHLQDDAESAGRFHDFWTREIAPTWRCQLEVTNDAVAADADGLARTAIVLEAVRRLLGT